MATLTVLKSSRAGVQMSPTAAAGGGDDFPNDGKTIFQVYNGSGGSIDVDFALTVDPFASEPTQAVSSVSQAVPAGEDHVFGPFPTKWFGSSVAVTYSGVTSLTVLPISIG